MRTAVNTFVMVGLMVAVTATLLGCPNPAKTPANVQNHDPVIKTNLPPSGSVEVGQYFDLSVASTDQEGDVLSYTWQESLNGVDWASVGSNSSLYRFSKADVGDWKVRVIVSDGKGGTTTSSICTIAVIVIPTFRVIYNGNGETGGNVPVDNTEYRPGSRATVLGNTGDLVRPGYNFAGWNTDIDCLGGSYAQDATIVIEDGSIYLYAIWIPDNLIFVSSDNSILVYGYWVQPVGEIVIPNGVTSVGSYAGHDAFRGCTTVTRAVIPSTVTSIGNNAFSSSGLEAFDLAEGVVTIGNYAFYQTNLKSVSLPASLVSLGGSAFYYCTSLESVSIPSGIDTIQYATFGDCKNLTSITIPSNIKVIGGDAFRSCINLTTVNILQGVEVIGDGAFEDCSKMESITLPSSITKLGKYVFKKCVQLSNVTLLGTTPTTLDADSESFDSCSLNLRIHVPSVALSSYKSATGWNKYSALIVSP